MKHPREHLETYTRTAAEAMLDALDVKGGLPTGSEVKTLRNDPRGSYVMVKAKDGNYDILFEYVVRG